jgi:hypothetical protein
MQAETEHSRAGVPAPEATIRYIYNTLLGREPGADALANCVQWLASGATIQDIHNAITDSAEYRSRDNHPLSHISEVYTPNNISYFTHRGRYRPLGLSIETVNICNNDCIICPYSAQTRRRQGMSAELFAKIVRDYAEVGGGPVTLTPMVGEVFLDKRLLERLQLLRATPSITGASSITNATMVSLYSDEELAELLSLFDRLTVSVYGLDAEEFAIMTRKARYDEFITGLVRLLRIAGPAKVSLGARHLKKRTDGEISEWLAAIAGKAGIAPDAIRFAGTTTYANWSFFDTNSPLPFDAQWSPVALNEKQCALPLISMQILSDGTVSFCGCANFNGDTGLTIGNIAQNSLAEILDTEQVRRLWNWKAHGTPDFCKSCSFHMPIDRLTGLPGAFSDPYRTFGG